MQLHEKHKPGLFADWLNAILLVGCIVGVEIVFVLIVFEIINAF